MGGGGGGESHSTTSTTNMTTVSTADVKDAFNQTANNIRNLSEVGNVSIAAPDSSTPTVILIMGLAAVGLFALFITKGKV